MALHSTYGWNLLQGTTQVMTCCKGLHLLTWGAIKPYIALMILITGVIFGLVTEGKSHFTQKLGL